MKFAIFSLKIFFDIFLGDSIIQFGAKSEDLNMDLFRSTTKPVQKVMEDDDMQTKDVDEIVLVGGKKVLFF